MTCTLTDPTECTNSLPQFHTKFLHSGFLFLVDTYSCQGTIPKIRNNYSQERSCTAAVTTPTFMFLWEIYIQYSSDRSAYSAAGKYVGRTYIDRSQTHKCGNWDWGLANPFLGIYKFINLCSLDLLYWALTTQSILKIVKVVHVRQQGFAPSLLLYSMYSS